MPPDAVAQAGRCAKDLRSFEYREQIVAARAMQKLGVAAAPHASLLAGRLADPHFQMRRACAEAIRLIAEISKELALDRAEAEAEAAAAAAAAEAALEAKRAAEAEAEAAALAAGRKPSKHRGNSKVRVTDEPEHVAVAHDGDHHHHHHHASHRNEHHFDGEEGDHHFVHHDHPHHRSKSHEPPKAHKAGWFSGKGHDDHSDLEQEAGEGDGEGDEDQEHHRRRHSKAHSHRSSHHGSHHGSAAASRAGSHGQTEAHIATDIAQDGAEEPSHGEHAASEHSGHAESSASESSESEEEVEITPRSAAFMADPRSAVVPYVEQLATALKDDMWQVRLTAARALAAIGGDEVADDAIVSAVVPVLDDVHQEVRCAAAEVFTSVGLACGRLAGEPVAKATQDAGDSVRYEAVKALSAMGKNVPPKCQAMKIFCKMLQNDENEHVRVEAAKAIGRAGRGAIYGVDALAAGVTSDSSRWVRHAALDVIIELGSRAIEQLASALECQDIEVRRIVVKHLGTQIVDVLESQSEARKPKIEERKVRLTKEQEDHFAEKKRVKIEAKREKCKARREEAKNLGHETPPSSDDSVSESEEGLGDEELEEEAGRELDAALTSYIEAIAAKLTDPDEQMRQVAVESLKLLQTVVEPHSGRQLLVWQDGRWKARLVADYT